MGLLILAAQLSHELSRALEHAEQHRCALVQAEKELFGASHAEIGGYLLDLWGLPEQVVEAIAWHYYPSSAPSAGYDTQANGTLAPITAVHVANYFCEDQELNGTNQVKAEIDTTHLELTGLSHRIGEWWDHCRATCPA